MNHIFYVRSFFSYIMDPLLNGFIGTGFDLFMSFIRILLKCPFIQFYIYFIWKSILTFGDLITEIPLCFKSFKVELHDTVPKTNFLFWVIFVISLTLYIGLAYSISFLLIKPGVGIYVFIILGFISSIPFLFQMVC